MKVYLDVCCLSRPFDDQSHDRVRLESEAVKLLLDLHAKSKITWVSSEAVEDEVRRNPDDEKRSAVQLLLQSADLHLVIDERSVLLAREFAAQGLPSMDALHLALAESSACDIILTTDDSFLRSAQRLLPPPNVRIENPARWIVEVIEG